MRWCSINERVWKHIDVLKWDLWSSSIHLDDHRKSYDRIRCPASKGAECRGFPGGSDGLRALTLTTFLWTRPLVHSRGMVGILHFLLKGDDNVDFGGLLGLFSSSSTMSTGSELAGLGREGEVCARRGRRLALRKESKDRAAASCWLWELTDLDLCLRICGRENADWIVDSLAMVMGDYLASKFGWKSIE